MWRKSSRPAPDLVRRMPTSEFRTSSTRQRPIWTTPERQRPNCLCGSLPLCFSAPLLPVWQPRKAEKSGILTPVLPTGRRDRNRGGNHGSWNSALPVGSSHSDHHPSRPLAALDRRGVLRDIVQLVLFDAGLAHVATKTDSLLHVREASNRRKITFDCDCVAAAFFKLWKSTPKALRRKRDR